MLLTLAASLALAAPVTLDLDDHTLLAGRPVTAGPVVSAATPVPLTDPVLTFDTRGLAGIATAAPGPGGASTCTSPAPGRLACTPVAPLVPGPVPLRNAATVTLTPAPGAEPGDSGRLTVTLTARGRAPVSHTATVRIGEPVDLSAGPATPVQAAPGAPFDVVTTVRNTAPVTVRGVSVAVGDEWAFQPRERFRNCRYAAGRLLSCRFDQSLAPGASYRLVLPHRLRADSQAPRSFTGTYRWVTAAAAADARLDRAGQAGNGPMLQLDQAGGGVARPGAVPGGVPQADPDPSDDTVFAEVIATGRQGFDLVALGGPISGRGLTVGVRNAGPATTDAVRAGENAATVDVVLPAGVAVDRVPAGCRLRTALRYRCSASYFLRAGTAETFHFGLRPGRARPGATGSVTVRGMGVPDLDPATDRTTLTVASPAGAPTRPAPGAAGRPGTGPAGLPVTGPPGLATAGLALLLTGTALTGTPRLGGAERGISRGGAGRPGRRTAWAGPPAAAAPRRGRSSAPRPPRTWSS